MARAHLFAPLAGVAFLLALAACSAEPVSSDTPTAAVTVVAAESDALPVDVPVAGEAPQFLDRGTPASLEMEKPAATAAFDFEDVRKLAAERAAKPYAAQPALMKDAAAMDYDAYRRIQNREDASLWATAADTFRVVPDPRGYLFTTEVKLNIIENGDVRPRSYMNEDFRFFDLPLEDDTKKTLGFAGFRVLTPLNVAGKFDELISFRGASFFRALGTGNLYGASARGLSIGTASPEGEKFPHFSEFWLVAPKPGDDAVSMFALLDGESATGAYEFRVSPGPETKVDVNAVVFPRTTLTSVGIAPLTSMYFFSPHDLRKNRDDFRPAVHDSEGLALHMANGEWVWRPLLNPNALQIAVLANQAPLAFGLVQRKRGFDDYADIESGYHDRPTIWVEPKSDWGEGYLTLVEIPTVNEYNDNIVAFWKPASPWQEGNAYSFSYTMSWGLAGSVLMDVATVSDTFAGLRPGSSQPMFIVDYEDIPAALLEGAKAEVSASSGEVQNVTLRYNPETGKVRLSFDLDPQNADVAELRALITRGGKPITETWLYRWWK
ncbi:MAG: glucan biosynthesis protein G [Hyphomonas sp.]